MNTSSWIYDIAQYEYDFDKDTPISEIYQYTNEVAEANNQARPFHQTDIETAKIFEACRDDYHSNLLIAWQSYQRAWTDLHITYQTLREDLNPYSEKLVVTCYQALDVIDHTYLLTDNLNSKTLTYLECLLHKASNYETL